MKQSIDATILDELDDLATGQLGLVNAWRLRRRISRDVELAREWRAVRSLHSGLRLLSGESTDRRTAVAQPSTLSFGGVKMQRRTAALAAAVVGLFSVTAAVAKRCFQPPDAETDLTMQGFPVDTWNFKGKFRGNITLYSCDDPYRRSRTTQLQGSSSSGEVRVKFSKYGITLAQTTLKGSRHFEVRDRSGKLYGIVALSPMTGDDERQIAAASDARLESYLAYYRQRSRITPSEAKQSFEVVTSLPGVTGGVFFHDLVHKNDMVGDIAGGSWKVYGNARVKAVFYDMKRTERLPGGKTWDAATRKLISGITFPAKTLVETGCSCPTSSDFHLSGLTAARGEALAKACIPLATPECDWVLADPVPGFDEETGIWNKVQRSGTFVGYGRHVVNDAKGKPVMVIEVSPLTPGKPAR